MTDPGGLLAGYTRLAMGRAAYAGALRRKTGRDPVWTCPCRPHLTAARATACAAAELEQRVQGRREVFTLLRCEGCGTWHGDAAGRCDCPDCSVPMTRLKVAVLERGLAVPPHRRGS
jgi:hypothetical protein